MSVNRSVPKKKTKPTALTRLREQLQTVDLLFEVRDARLPHSSRHPKAQELFGHKPKVIVLAKQDLADPDALKQWLVRFSEQEMQEALALCFKLNKGQDKLVSASVRLTEEKRALIAKRGLLPRPMRACVVGLPNVGKSTLINWLCGRHKAKTGDTPGITRGTQWIRIHPQLEMLDTPGILPSVAFSKEVEMKLSLCNILPNDQYDVEEVANFGLQLVASVNPEALKMYGSELVETTPNLENLAKARSCVATGGVPDTRRAAALFLNDIRSARLGRFVFDKFTAD